jgi:hypothetical protein
MIEAAGSSRLGRATNSRSRALSCSAVPIESGWKPVICECRQRGIASTAILCGLHASTRRDPPALPRDTVVQSPVQVA